MISKASELLELFIKNETEKLMGINMPHMPTLGSAYEEITKQGIDQRFTIPKSLNLKVVSGFVSIDNEMLAEQIDCMLVHGEGKQYGLTEQYIYPIDSILCIFEVKKTLRKVDYIDAFDHLRKIRIKYAAYFEKKLMTGDFEPNISSASKHFSQITGKSAPNRYLDIHSLSKPDGILFYTLVQESLAPISIIHGYNGYRTESGLRKSFIDLLEDRKNVSQHGLGVPSFPSLVTSNEFCLIKTNGFPFLALLDDSSWVAIASTRYNPVAIILEMIWSKISFYFNIKMPWGDGLEMENLSPLLIAESAKIGEKIGWVYKTIELKESSLIREKFTFWKPKKISEPAMSLINIMATRGSIELDDERRSYINDKYQVTLDSIIEELLNTNYFMLDEQILRPIQSTTIIITNEDETGYVASDRKLFDQWCTSNGVERNYMFIVLFE